MGLRNRLGDQIAWAKWRLRLARQSRSSSQRVIVLQSSDNAYAPFLEVSGSANRAYAAHQGYAYADFIGNVSPRPRTANFNRYYLLRAAVHHTSHRWAMWIDADAIVIDPTVDLAPIIDADRNKLVIACRGKNFGEFDINNGVFLFNLRHRDASRFLQYLITASHRVNANNSGFNGDQKHMQTWLLRRMDSFGRISCVKRYAGSQSNMFNYDGPFIRHVLRTWGNFDERLGILRDACRLSAEKLASERC